MHGWIRVTHAGGPFDIWVQISRIDHVRPAGDVTQIVQGGEKTPVRETVEQVMKLISLAQ